MNDESSYISFNMTMPIETKWWPFFKMADTDFCLSFVPAAKHVRILSQVTKYNLLWIGNVVTVQTQ